MKLKPWMALLLSLSTAPHTAALSTEHSARITELSNEIRHYRQLYYQGLPSISDQHFDALIAELRQLLPGHPVLGEVGTAVSVSPQRLSAPMLSLASVWDDSAIDKFVRVVRQQWPGAQLLIQPKFDGMALELVYQHGQLVRAVTRGDGRTGQDITANVMASGAVPLLLDSAVPRVVIRGELYADSGRYQAQFRDKYSSARQLAVSTALSEQPAARQLRALRFIPWVWLDAEHDSALAGLEQLEAWGFASMAQLTATSAQHKSARTDFFKHWKQKRALGAELDGVVLSLDSQKLRREWGETASEPRWAVAWKFDTPQTVTRVTAVHWQQGRTGRLTPVVELEPVELMGRTVSRVSGRSLGWMQVRQIGIGSQVAITLKGAAIPQITEVVSASGELPEPPDVVPGLCVTRKPGCEQRLLLQLEHVRKSLGMDSPSPQQLRALVAQRKITSVSGLLEQFSPSQPPALEQQLAALGLPQLSRKARANLAAHINSLGQLNALTQEQWQLFTSSKSQAAWIALQQSDMREEIERLEVLLSM